MRKILISTKETHLRRYTWKQLIADYSPISICHPRFAKHDNTTNWINHENDPFYTTALCHFCLLVCKFTNSSVHVSLFQPRKIMNVQWMSIRWTAPHPRLFLFFVSLFSPAPFTFLFLYFVPEACWSKSHFTPHYSFFFAFDNAWNQGFYIRLPLLYSKLLNFIEF